MNKDNKIGLISVNVKGGILVLREQDREVALLSPTQARWLAIELLSKAEDVDGFAEESEK